MAEALDVGCGSGLLISSLAQAGVRVTGLDLSSDQLERARFRCQGQSVDLRLDGVEMLRDGETFDAVCAIGVLPYVPDQNGLVQTLCDHVAPGGWLVLSLTRAATPFVWVELLRHVRRFRPIAAWWRISWNLIRTGIWSGGFIEGRGGRRLGRRALDRLLIKAGFEPRGHFGLFNIEALDARSDRKDRLIDALAARWGWSIIVFYRCA